MTLASDAEKIFRAGIAAVDPAWAVQNNLRRRGSTLRLGSRSLSLDRGGTIRLVSVGKAAGAMLDAATRALGESSPALAVTPRGYPGSREARSTLFGEHPVPGVGSFRAGQALLKFVRQDEPEDLVLFLISGGGSAVAEVPRAGLTPTDLARTTVLLLGSGVPIGAMNAVRRHLSQIKGGQLAAAAGPARFATLALSDVVGDAPEDIASGPTVPDPSTFEDAMDVVREYDLGPRLPTRVVRHLSEGAQGKVAETPKPGDSRFRHAPFVLVGSNRHAVEAAALAAKTLGYRTEVVERPIVGETRPAAVRFARRLLATPPTDLRALIAGGETTVVLGPRPGRGGRNQEFALTAARTVAGRNAVVLSGGTDGIDGPTDAAGGWVDGTTWSRSSLLGLDLTGALARHAAYDALRRLGSLLTTGPTGTNVMDLHVGLLEASFSPSTAGSTRRGGAPSNRRRPS
ncbi:MAG: glycerate kinase [Thermoplasmata archaeon]